MARTVSTRKLADALRVKPGAKVSLKDFDAGQTFGHDKATALQTAAELEARLRRSRTGCGQRPSTRS
jgi:hypothetical protein